MSANQQRRPTRLSPGGVGAFLFLLLPIGTLPLHAQVDPFDAFFDPLAREPLRLELIVEDEQGRRVPGLELDDFVLELDGAPARAARVRSFEGLRGDPERLAERLLPAGEEVTLAVFLDRAGVEPEQEERLLTRLAATLLPLLRGPDRVLPFVFQGGLHRGEAIGGDETGGEERFLEAIRSLTADMPSPPADPELTLARLESLERVLDALVGAEGRRILLYVGRVPLDVEEPSDEGAASPVVPAPPDPWAAAEPAAVDPRLAPMLDSADASLVTLYTLDPRQLAGESCGGEGTIPADKALTAVAALTGGASITPCGEAAPEPLASDLAGYYRVEIPLAEVGLGVPRRLRAAARSPRLSVRHRASFFDRAARDRAGDLALAGLLLDRTANPLAVEIEAGEARRVAAETYTMPLTLRVPFRQVRFQPRGREHAARLHVSVAAYNEHGLFTALESFESPLRVANDQLSEALRRVGVVEVEATLRPGRQRLVLAVHDEHAGSTSTLVLDLDPEEGG